MDTIDGSVQDHRRFAFADVWWLRYRHDFSFMSVFLGFADMLAIWASSRQSNNRASFKIASRCLELGKAAPKMQKAVKPHGKADQDCQLARSIFPCSTYSKKPSMKHRCARQVRGKRQYCGGLARLASESSADMACGGKLNAAHEARLWCAVYAGGGVAGRKP